MDGTMSSPPRSLRIGCASGFWGDSRAGAAQLVAQGGLDVLVFDYLAEITLSLLARVKRRRPDSGYVPDALDVLTPLLPEIARQGIKVVTNGGGMNPTAAGELLVRRIAEAGLTLRVAVVTGDDVSGRGAEFREAGLTDMSTGAPFSAELVSANAYLGAAPIAAALAEGADIVITGRCVDSAVTLGPLVHAFGWSWTDYDRLAAGSLAGHLLECGAQGTGGLFTDWRDVPGWDDMGFPIAICEADGTFVLTKPEGTGGLITPLSAAEQMLYEIHDPAAYALPDVICDFTAVTLAQDGENRVRVSGPRGRAPSGKLKVSATWHDGFRTIGAVTIPGLEAAEKAQRVGDSILTRCRRLLSAASLADFTETSIEVLGAEGTYGPHASPGARASREVVLKIGARHEAEAALEFLAREIAPAATAMAQGITGFYAGRPGVQPVMRIFSFLADAATIPATVTISGRSLTVPSSLITTEPPLPLPQPIPEVSSDEPLTAVPLIALAVGRSGDKGDIANIGVIAREPAFLPWIAAALSAGFVMDWFVHTGVTRVERHHLPGVHALNFVLHDALGGGGVASLRIDPQGKAFAQMLMDAPVPVPITLARRARPSP
jgi:hypothetical protein